MPDDEIEVGQRRRRKRKSFQVSVHPYNRPDTRSLENRGPAQSGPLALDKSPASRNTVDGTSEIEIDHDEVQSFNEPCCSRVETFTNELAVKTKNGKSETSVMQKMEEPSQCDVSDEVVSESIVTVEATSEDELEITRVEQASVTVVGEERPNVTESQEGTCNSMF